MSALSSHFESAAAQINSDLSDTIAYLAGGGAGTGDFTDVTCIIGAEQDRSMVENDGIKTVSVLTLSFARTAAAADGGPVAGSIRLHDQVTVNGWLYSIEAIVSQSEHWTRVEAHRRAVREKTKQGYRRT